MPVFGEDWILGWSIAFVLGFLCQTGAIVWLWHRSNKQAAILAYLKKEVDGVCLRQSSTIPMGPSVTVHRPSAEGYELQEKGRSVSGGHGSDEFSPAGSSADGDGPASTHRDLMTPNRTGGMRHRLGLSPALSVGAGSHPGSTDRIRGAFAAISEVERRGTAERKNLNDRLQALEMRTQATPYVAPPISSGFTNKSPIGKPLTVAPVISNRSHRSQLVDDSRSFALLPLPSNSPLVGNSAMGKHSAQDKAFAPASVAALVTTVPPPVSTLVCLLHIPPVWVDPHTASARHMIPYQLTSSEGALYFSQIDDVHEGFKSPNASAKSAATMIPVQIIRAIVLYPCGPEVELGADQTTWYPMRFDLPPDRISLPPTMMKGAESDRWWEEADGDSETGSRAPSRHATEPNSLVAYFLSEMERNRWSEWLQVHHFVPSLPCDVEYPKSALVVREQAEPDAGFGRSPSPATKATQIPKWPAEQRQSTKTFSAERNSPFPNFSDASPPNPNPYGQYSLPMEPSVGKGAMSAQSKGRQPSIAELPLRHAPPTFRTFSEQRDQSPDFGVHDGGDDDEDLLPQDASPPLHSTRVAPPPTAPGKRPVLIHGRSSGFGFQKGQSSAVAGKRNPADDFPDFETIED